MMKLNLPALSKNDLRVRTVTGVCRRNTELTSADREEHSSSVRIRGEKHKKLSLCQGLGCTHSLKLDRGHILGFGTPIGARSTAVTCYAKVNLTSSTWGFSGRSSVPALNFSKKRKTQTESRLMVRAVNTQDKEKESPDVEATTRKWGLEAGLWQIFTSKEEGAAGKGKKTSQAKELLARYGGAYLATSISLSLVSFSLCYVLINSGVDVAALLQKVGIQPNETGEKVGTFALAYAAHKAASPIRFPPTVALTPIVAGWFGKKTAADDESKP